MSNRYAQANEIDAEVLAVALSEASVAADGSVMNPVEGTILTVVREVAKAARDAANSESILRTVELALEEGEAA